MKGIVAAPPVKKFAGSAKKGFLNSPPREVKDAGVVGLPSPPSCHIIPSSVEGNGFSQSQNWPVGFDKNGGDCCLGEGRRFLQWIALGLGDGWFS
jgi:hypothetical protein